MAAETLVINSNQLQSSTGAHEGSYTNDRGKMLTVKAENLCLCDQ